MLKSLWLICCTSPPLLYHLSLTSSFVLTEMSPSTTGEAVRRTLEACAPSAAEWESTRWWLQHCAAGLLHPQKDDICSLRFPVFFSMATVWPWQGLCPRVWHRTWASSGTQLPREVRMKRTLVFPPVGRVIFRAAENSSMSVASSSSDVRGSLRRSDLFFLLASL